MKIRVIRSDYSDCPSSMRKLGWNEKTQVRVSAGGIYEVQAVAVERNMTMLLVLNDYSLPDWLPAWLVEVADASTDDDWICTFWENDPTVLLGPSFIAESPAAYLAMVDFESEQCARFDERIALKRRQVRATRNLGDRVPAGAVGAVLEVYRGAPNSYLVEFSFRGVTLDVIAVPENDLEISDVYLQELLRS